MNLKFDRIPPLFSGTLGATLDAPCSLRAEIKRCKHLW